MYSISESGVTVFFPMAQLNQAPRVVPSQEDVVFRGNFCNSGPITQQLDVVDPAGNATPFQICVAGSNSCSAAGIPISPSSGVTSTHVKISIDPTVIGGPIGTKELKFEIRSTAAGNKPAPRCSSFSAITWSGISRRQLPIQRFASPFCQGASTPVRFGSNPAASKKAITSASNFRSRSRIT
jgi:hypothetical protein